jgi:tetratricopeptide (TPR) repeat protein
MVQNFHLVWLDGNGDADCRNSMMKLREVVNNVSVFSDVDQCVDFITDIKEEKTFMIISEEFSEMIMPFIQDISQVTSVHIFCRNNTEHAKSVTKWPKINGVYSSIEPICEALKQAVQDHDHNSVSINFVKTTDGTSNQSLDTLDQSFMHTQILKEILLTIDFQNEHINDFLKYCREQFVGNSKELENVDKIEKEYHHHLPIWWYTYNCFLYSMLNRALRLMEVDLIVKMGFFIRDLHNHITKLHSEQYGEQNHSESFTIYRGQGLSQIDFDQMKNSQGGLLAFNNFLSTSRNRDVSLRFARRTITTSDLMGVLFILRIDPSISATPFANVKNVSFYQREEEILFSMHSVFRIESVKQIDKNDRLWQVELTLTGDKDRQLYALTERMRQETNGLPGWYRLSKLMIDLGQFDQANELNEVLLKQAGDGSGKAAIFNNLALIAERQGKYEEAITVHEKALEIFQKTLPANHPLLATSYNNIGNVYKSMGEYSKALSYFEKALEIRQKTLPANHPDFAESYSNIAAVYYSMSEYLKALSYYEKALEIYQKTLPANHPLLATSYNNIGNVYKSMGEYSKALSYFEKALEIRQKTLPANHLDLATSYDSIGMVYRNMGEYSKALSYYDKAFEIKQKTLPANHLHLAGSYNNIGLVYYNMGKYSNALSYSNKALEIRQKNLPENHPDLAQSYNNIGNVYDDMGEYSKTLLYYNKALEIREKALPANHPHLATTYNNIGGVYYKMDEFSEALLYLERALNIWQRSLPSNHPNLQTIRKNIETIKRNCK